MTNKEIRRRAWELCRENFGLILSATFLMSLISTVMMEVASWTGVPLLTLLAFIFLMILSAIMSLGMVRFMLDIWHGETPKLSVLFSQKHRLGTYICYNWLLSLGLIAAVALPLSIVLFMTTSAAAVVALIIMLIAIILVLWIVLRLEMAVTCMVIRHSYRATECLRTAWRASKGNVRRLFCNAFVLGFPLGIAQGLLIGYQTYLLMSGQMLTDLGYILLDIGSVLISALLSSYIYLGTYPLHEQLLETYFANHPEKSAAEMWTEPLLSSDEPETPEENPNNPPET